MVSAVAIGQVGKGDKADKLSTWELNEGTVVDIIAGRRVRLVGEQWWPDAGFARRAGLEDPEALAPLPSFIIAGDELFVAAFGDDRSADAGADGAVDGDPARAESPDDGDAPRDDGEAASPEPGTGKSGPKRPPQQKRSSRGTASPSPKTKKRK